MWFNCINTIFFFLFFIQSAEVASIEYKVYIDVWKNVFSYIIEASHEFWCTKQNVEINLFKI